MPSASRPGTDQPSPSAFVVPAASVDVMITSTPCVPAQLQRLDPPGGVGAQRVGGDRQHVGAGRVERRRQVAHRRRVPGHEVGAVEDDRHQRPLRPARRARCAEPDGVPHGDGGDRRRRLEAEPGRAGRCRRGTAPAGRGSPARRRPGSGGPREPRRPAPSSGRAARRRARARRRRRRAARRRRGTRRAGRRGRAPTQRTPPSSRTTTRSTSSSSGMASMRSGFSQRTPGKSAGRSSTAERIASSSVSTLDRNRITRRPRPSPRSGPGAPRPGAASSPRT